MNFFDEICIFGKRKMAFWWQNPLDRTNIDDVCYDRTTNLYKISLLSSVWMNSQKMIS